MHKPMDQERLDVVASPLRRPTPRKTPLEFLTRAEPAYSILASDQHSLRGIRRSLWSPAHLSQRLREIQPRFVFIADKVAGVAFLLTIMPSGCVPAQRIADPDNRANANAKLTRDAAHTCLL